MYQSINNNNGSLNNKRIDRTVATNVETDDSLLLKFRAESNYTKDEFLKKEIENLKKAIGTTVLRIPKVTISSLSNALDKDNLRIVLILGDHSHLVKGIEDAVGKGFGQDEQYDLIVSFKDKTEIYELIRDVFFDILMFHLYKCDNKFPEIKDKKNYSLLKVEFCKSKGFIEQNLNVRYVSLAMFAKNDTIFDYDKYVKLCEEFMQYLDSKCCLNDRCNGKDISIIELVNCVIEKHPNGLQLSKRYLIREISKIKDNRFLIIRTKKKPKTEKVRNRILGMLGGKKWKTGIVRIRKYSDIYLYERYEPYISVFIVER